MHSKFDGRNAHSWNVDRSGVPIESYGFANIEHSIPATERTVYEIASIERVTRQSYAEALRDRILSPLGMTATGMNDPGEIVLHRAAGYRWEHTTETLGNKPYYSPSVTYAVGGQLSTIADLVKWEQALQQGTPIGQSGLEAMWQPQLSTHGNEWEHLRYAVALGCFVFNYEGRRVVGHNGSILGLASNITRSTLR